jgi:orotate phosphoribosyltransferase
VITLVDREQGGAEFYRSKDLTFRALFSITEIQAIARDLYS